LSFAESTRLPGTPVRAFPILSMRHRASANQIVIGIQEVPASQAMEMGQVMPDIANE